MAPLDSGRSLLTRVAVGATLSAALAALVAAIVTSTFATYLVNRSDDRRIGDAAAVLAGELDDPGRAHMTVSEIVADEHREMSHTGIGFAVFDASSRELIAGDVNVPLVTSGSCVLSRALHVCSRATRERGLQVVAATAYNRIASLLALSSAVAALLAGIGAWWASRPMARLMIGPLSELRRRVGLAAVSGGRAADLGPSIGILEVDELRETIRDLLSRIAEEVQHAERFAADAAHELRTPLTSIRGELELLAEGTELSPETLADLTRAKSKLVELQSLVERLLVLAVPSQREHATSELISLQDVIEDLTAQMPAADRQRLQLGEPRGDVVIYGDVMLLGTLVSNALSNALKFGSVVRASVFEAGNDAVLLISDDGPGVPVDHRQRVFEPFIRVPSAVERRVSGHGLGLTLIAHVARWHGGSAKFIDGSPGAHLEVRLPRRL